eukprot:TRINITY_DN11575_c0_g2_i1.p1 TRINITY_DN11575_c0_g2~~TRINITY_DN11575_c0_g2_i1.p1  ORF type:complete len:611 (+),score=115.97 TRINITY_DN11575_c0_g2_i1:47-1834(+)
MAAEASSRPFAVALNADYSQAEVSIQAKARRSSLLVGATAGNLSRLSNCHIESSASSCPSIGTSNNRNFKSNISQSFLHHRSSGFDSTWHEGVTTGIQSRKRVFCQCVASGDRTLVIDDAVNTDRRDIPRVSTILPLGGVVVTNESVPEGHRGLHGLLYGEDGEDVHGGVEGTEAFSPREDLDTGATIVPFPEYLAARDGQKFAGVYAVYNAEGGLEYVGYGRNVVLALKGHRNARGEGVCAAVRVKVWRDASLVSRGGLEEERQKWLLEHGGPGPRGNGVDMPLWEGPNGPGTAAMSAAELDLYEDKKMKMRKAMGENLHDDASEGEGDDAKARRLKLLQATEGDDWSSVIGGQTSDSLAGVLQQVPKLSSTPEAAVNTEDGTSQGALSSDARRDDIKSPSTPRQEASMGEVPSGSIVSPFERLEVPLREETGVKPAAEEKRPLTVESVDLVLDEVRPYLMADGGNVEVAAVEKGVIMLKLIGACGTCPSSTSTMKMGIERSLYNAFGDDLKEVIQLDGPTNGGGVTVQEVETFMEYLQPTIDHFKGRTQVVSVDVKKSLCQVKFDGPAPIGMGIQAAVKDKFPSLRVVELLSF